MLGGMTLEDFFELAATCHEWNMSVECMYQMVPWHFFSIVDISQFKMQEKLERMKNQRGQLGSLF